MSDLVQIHRRVLTDARRKPGEEPVFETRLGDHQTIVAVDCPTPQQRPDRKTVDWRAEVWIASRLTAPPAAED